MDEIRVRISDIIFRNDENGYTVAVGENDSEQFTVVGMLPDSSLNREFILRGKTVVHSSYGEQFAFSEFEEVMPSDVAGIEAFLSSGLFKGTGPKTAKAIVSKFGDETLKILEENPDRISEVRGIGKNKAAELAEAFKKQKELADVVLFFAKYGVSADYAMKLYKVYGAAAKEVAEKDPYMLIEDIDGIGFRKADAIAEKMGFARNNPSRIKSGINYTLEYYCGEGNVFLPEELLLEKAAELLDVSSEEMYDVLCDLALDARIKLETFEGRNVAYPMTYYIAEKSVARKLSEMANSKPREMLADIDGLIGKSEKLQERRLSKSQKQAVKDSLNSGVFVITGGPGTGKTTIINTIMDVLSGCGMKTAIAAPTGRAAKRITETGGYPASTVHRLLEYTFDDEGRGMSFGRNSENTLEQDAIIVDEASMIDLSLMKALLDALNPGARLILVGDADQLPPVGAGNVLRDVIESGVIPFVKLTEIFRQAEESMIVVNAHRINRGEYPECNEKGKDFFLARAESEKVMLDTVKELCGKRLPAFFKELDAKKDIQVLTPVRKGLLGTGNINKELQAILNPPSLKKTEKKYADRVFREGDKVMQIKNNYNLKWKKTGDFSEGDGVFNGDVGYIDRIDNEYGEMGVVFDDDKYVTYDFSQLDELELAYAITVHKSQGSEFGVVVMPVSWFPPMLATRNLFYTAVTRGKTAVVLVGSENKMKAMVDNNRISQRYSGLKTRLCEYAKPYGSVQ